MADIIEFAPVAQNVEADGKRSKIVFNRFGMIGLAVMLTSGVVAGATGDAAQLVWGGVSLVVCVVLGALLSIPVMMIGPIVNASLAVKHVEHGHRIEERREETLAIIQRGEANTRNQLAVLSVTDSVWARDLVRKSATEPTRAVQAQPKETYELPDGREVRLDLAEVGASVMAGWTRSALRDECKRRGIRFTNGEEAPVRDIFVACGVEERTHAWQCVSRMRSGLAPLPSPGLSIEEWFKKAAIRTADSRTDSTDSTILTVGGQE